jgi:large subunit ribosomal protein L24
MMQETKRVKNPGKQRKRLFNAPAHIRHKLMAAPLSSELTASRGAKTLPVRKGDTVRIQRGDNKGFEGKVSRVDPKNFRVYLEGLTREKVDGTNIFISVHPSKIQIRNLNLDDKRRKEVLGRKKEIEKPGQEKAKVKPTKKVEKAQAKIAEIEEEKPVEPEVAKTTKEEELVEKVPDEIEEKTSDEVDTEEEAPVAKKAIAKKPAAKKPFAKKDEAPEAKKKLAEEEAPAKKTVKAKAPAKKTAPKSSTKSKVSKEGGQ